MNPHFLKLIVLLPFVIFNVMEAANGSKEELFHQLLQNPPLLQQWIKEEVAFIHLHYPYVDKIVAPEGRSFVMGSLLSYALEKPFVIYRQEAKLPKHPFKQFAPQLISHQGEQYLSSTESKKVKMAIQEGAITPGEKILLVGDDFYKDYTMRGCNELLQQVGGVVVGEVRFKMPVNPPQPFEKRESLLTTSEINHYKMILEDPKTIRNVPGFPNKNILFKDITPLLANPKAYQAAIKLMSHYLIEQNGETLAMIESRGFLLAPVAALLGLPMVPIYKKGKNRGDVVSVTVNLEYKNNEELETSVYFKTPDAKRILIVDDLLATGGTFLGGYQIAEKLGYKTSGFGVMINLPDLQGIEKLKPYAPVYSLIAPHDQPLNVLVASMKDVKINAAFRAFQEQYPDKLIVIKGMNAPSYVPEQPYEIKEGLKGANQRLLVLQNSPESSQYDFLVAIENFIAQDEVRTWRDYIALVVYDSKHNHKIEKASKNGVMIPARYVEECMQEGRELITVGQVIQRHFKKLGREINSADWAKEIEFGGKSREEYIKEIISDSF